MAEIKRPKGAQYSPAQFNDFKKVLANTLYEKAMTVVDIANNTDAKNYIANFVEQNIVKRTEGDKLNGITYRFAHSTLSANEVDTYPIVNVYKGHFQTAVIYFSFNNGTTSAETLEINPSGIILL